MKDSDGRFIRLNGANIHEYGFALFCYPEEHDEILEKGYRTISLGPDADGSVEFGKIRIPGNYLRLLSEKKEQKLPHLAGFKIEGAEKQLKILKFLSRRSGWNQTQEDFKILLRMADESYFIAKILHIGIKIPLGSGALINIGENISWISMVLVHEEVRRQGIAATLMLQCLKVGAMNEKIRIVGLDATPQGSQLYKRMGFKKSFSICRCLVPTQGLSRNTADGSVVPFYRYDEIRAYLYQKGFEYKDLLFRSLLDISRGGCYLIRTGTYISGIVMSRPGALNPYAGPLIADSDQDASRLLHQVLVHWNDRGEDRLLIDVPFNKLNTGKSGTDKDKTIEELPVTVKSGFIKVGRIIRTFDRMYHLVSEEEREFLYNYFIENLLDEKIIGGIIERSVNRYDETKNFIEKERNEMLRYQFAIGGPEYS